MGALTVVDSSVVIAALDRDDDLYGASTTALLEVRDSRLLLPIVAYAEVMVGAIRAGTRRRREVEGRLRRSFNLEPVSVEIAARASEVRSRYALPLPDALVLATGLELGATAILTGDRRWRKVHRSVVVVGRGAQGRRSARRRVEDEDHENHA
jgi:predicted nucleic acid-binding protein